ncbi:MAG TPA: hypothetical protein VJ600_04275 [Holophagaceae bacterium]|nr:hypothetical protein [Holophagaceae bacterium]
MLLPLPAPPPAIQTPAPSEQTYADAESVLLDRLDLGQPLGMAPALRGRERAAYQWLRSAATWKAGPAPAATFPPGSPEYREEETLRALVHGPLPSPTRIKSLSLSLGGSRLLLWQWLKAHRSRMAAPVRQAVEDRLAEPGPEILRGWALRHALCFALAERDQDRLGRLKGMYGVQSRDLFAGFQAAFAMLGGPSPVLRMWRLPELDYRDQGIGDLGSRRVWMAPVDAPPPPDSAWVIPSGTGLMGERESMLRGDELKEAEALAARFKADGRQAFFAASARDWEKQGLAYFPILIELDASKNIIAIKMGDAAPSRP